MQSRVNQYLCTMKKLCYGLALLAILGCKTRKVATESTAVHSVARTEAIAHVQSRDTELVKDNTIRRDSSTASATIEADSIVSTPGKVVIYPTKGKPFVYHASASGVVANNVITQHSRIVDSTGTLRQVVVTDSVHKTRTVDAKGSATVFAYTIPIVIGATLLLAFICWLIYKKLRP